MKKAIILCSGGIDSVVTAHYAKEKLDYKKITILFFNYGQKSLIAERKSSKQCAHNLKAKFVEIKLDWLKKVSTSLINKKGKIRKIKRSDLKDSKKESKKYYVPCRNTIFLTYSLALAELDKESVDIFVGFKCEGKESYPDTTIRFVNEMNNLSKIGCAKKVKIKTPLITKDKEDIIKLGKELKVDFKKTFTCYVGKKQHCGVCLACRLRQEGFYWANINDPTKYKEKMKDFRLAK